VASRGEPKISLFPFMSVLACTIGALIMLLVAMSLAAVGASDASMKAYTETKELVETDRQAIEEERLRLERAEALWSEIDAALEERGMTSGISSSSIERELDLAQDREAMAERLDEIEDQKRRLAEERDTIATTVAVLESRRETLPILIDSTGLSRHLKPFFIECDAGGATAYRTSDDFSYFVAKEDLSTSGDFGRYLRRARAYPGALLVLLVRTDGIGTMNRVHQVAAAAGMTRVAHLPLPGKGELDWSLLRRAETGGD
jgi:hypothetical protein